jgi:hypothetical protein
MLLITRLFIQMPISYVERYSSIDSTAARDVIEVMVPGTRYPLANPLKHYTIPTLRPHRVG